MLQSASNQKTASKQRFCDMYVAVLVEPFASVHDDGSRLGVILARGRGGFEAYAADNHSLGLFPSPRKAAAAITTTRRTKMPLPIHPHMLRHACGFKLANDGHDTRSLQHYLGRKNIQHMVRYTEMSPDRFKDFWRD